MMKTIHAYFSNHFDLVWRRGWERDTLYQGCRYPGYRRIEELCLLKNLELAEQGEGAYVVEQALTMRAFLERHPDALPRLQFLYQRGQFEVLGAGEAIIDVNMCSFETLCRNLASGVRYCRDVLGMPPLLANHGDGFGSSAQFPQVIRQCGLPGIWGLSYSYPDKPYWKGLDGSTVLVWGGVGGRGYFFDHCYHEACRRCHGLAPDTCETCRGTGLDLPQNFYPPFEPVAPDAIKGDAATYNVCSEEMLPPEGFSRNFRRWEQENPDVRYIWSTPRALADRWAAAAAAADHPPADQLASRVENNPVQTGCYVSRSRIKVEARRCEAALYGWETALALSCPKAMNPAAWEKLFLELPLFFFHDAVTGTHQDEAYAELMDRMQALRQQVAEEAERTLQRAGFGAARVPSRPEGGMTVQAFASTLHATPLRLPAGCCPWRGTVPLSAVTADGSRFPVVVAFHQHSPAIHPEKTRVIEAVGPTARTRPDEAIASVEVPSLSPLTWHELRLEPAAAPRPVMGRELRNDALAIDLGDNGIAAVRDLRRGTAIRAEDVAIGSLLLDEDEGDPWGTRKKPAFRRRLTEFTRFLGALRFDGYQEAYYGGRYEPNLPFGREQDPAIFALEWYLTVRLLDAGQRVDFLYEVFWKTSNRRVRAVFPVQAPSDEAWYGIPGGWLKRARYEQAETFLWSPNGDWPALHFVATEPAGREGGGWGVVNYGTPSNRVEDGRILVSLLRSPSFGHCLERYAQTYPMPTSGIRDNGWHHFTLSLVPHGGESDLVALASTAASLNQAPAVVAVPQKAVLPKPELRIEGNGIELIAAKRAFDSRDARTVIRLLNVSPIASSAALTMDKAARRSVTESSLVESPLRAPAPASRIDMPLRPFEAKTLMVDAPV